jgi:lysophospholipase L1-like esterase
MTRARSDRSSRVGLVLSRVALVLFGIVLGLGLSELVVRQTGLAPQTVLIREGRFQLSTNPLIAYEPLPGLWDWSGQPVPPDVATIHRNRNGFRTPEIPIEKPPGTKRIVVIGDSVAEGAQVANDELVFARQIETRLRRAGIAIDVVNLGVVAYTTLQEVEILKKRGLEYQPDLVIVSYCLNDPDGYYLWAINPLLKQADGVADDTLLGEDEITSALYESALFRFVKYRVLRPPTPSLRGRKFADYPQGDTVPRAFDELARLSREVGFQVVVVIFPLFAHEDPSFATYQQATKHAYAAQLAASHGFATIDLLDAFRTCQQKAGYTLAADVFHPTDEGHTCATEAIVPALGRMFDWAAPVLTKPGA